jgi:hypothetical protein
MSRLYVRLCIGMLSVMILSAGGFFLSFLLFGIWLITLLEKGVCYE